MIERAQEILDLEIKSLSNLPLNENIEKCVKLFANCQGKVIFMGVGKAHLVAKKIAASLSSTGTPSFCVHAGEMQHGDLGVISDQDVVVAISNSGKTHEVLLSLKLCKNTFSCPIIGITSNKESEMTKFCDLVLEIGKIKEACPFNLMPSSSSIVMMALGDILTILTMEEKQFTLEEYGKRHHSGYIGDVLREKIK